MAGRGTVGLGHHADLDHAVEYLGASAERLLRIVGGVVCGGRLHEPGQHGRLRKRELLGTRGEEVSRRRLDAIGTAAVAAAAEVGDVEVALEDLVLGQLVLDARRQPKLAQLADVAIGPRAGDGCVPLVWRLRLVEEDEFDVLLSQGGAATGGTALVAGDVAGIEVTEQRPCSSLHVYGAVLVEAVVLDGEDRVLHHRGDLVQ